MIGRLGRVGWAALALTAFAQAAVAAPASHAKLEGLRVQLVYETSGVLSDDIGAGFAAHNVIIGEGDAKEPASDLLVSVVLRSPEDDDLLRLPLILTVRKGGRILARRVFRGVLLKHGHAVESSVYDRRHMRWPSHDRRRPGLAEAAKDGRSDVRGIVWSRKHPRASRACC